MTSDDESDLLWLRLIMTMWRDQGRMIAFRCQRVASVHWVDRGGSVGSGKRREGSDVPKDTSQRVGFFGGEFGGEGGETVRDADIPILLDLFREKIAQKSLTIRVALTHNTDDDVDDPLLPWVKPSCQTSRLASHILPDTWSVSVPREHVGMIGMACHIFRVPQRADVIVMTRIGERIVHGTSLSGRHDS